MTLSSGNRALFLDRDGVINIDYGYVHSSKNFKFIEGIFELVRAAHAECYRVVVITNQAGIGRGYYSERQFRELTSWMEAQFEDAGAPIDKVYYSPYHPTAGIGKYRKNEDTRKPGAGMLLKARDELGLSLESSVLIGDNYSDILAGVTAGVKINLLLSKRVFPELAGIDYEVVPSLKHVIPYLKTPRTSPYFR